jgi:hypothetical protein
MISYVSQIPSVNLLGTLNSYIKCNMIVWLSLVARVFHIIQIEESRNEFNVDKVSQLEVLVCQEVKGVEHMLL